MASTFIPYDRTIFGPLTTTWTQPPPCSVILASCSTCLHGWFGQTCTSGNVVSDNTDCWPPRSTSRPAKFPLFAWGFYSPAYICPQGYTTACTATAGGRAGWDVAFSMVPGETAVGCCPTGFSCVQGASGLQTCLNMETATLQSSVFATATCGDGKTVNLNAVTGPVNATAPYTRLAPMFQLNFKQSDLPNSLKSTEAIATSSASSSAPTMAAVSSSTFSTVPQTSVPNTNGPGGPNEDGLSTGAKAGVGIGAALGALLIILLAVFLIRRRRKGPSDAAPGNAAELPVEEPILEKDSTPVSELYVVDKKERVPGAVEMPA